MKIGLLIMAAGYGSRFGGHKLLADIEGIPLFKIVIDKFDDFDFYRSVIISNEEKIKEYVKNKNIKFIKNVRQDLGQAYSIVLGIRELQDECDAILIAVCDQPGLSKKTIEKLYMSCNDPCKIIALKTEKGLGNPNIFGKKFFDDLLELKGDIGGKSIINSYIDDVIFIDVNYEELFDIDTKEDLAKIGMKKSGF